MTHSPARRPRFERAKVAGIVLTPRDLLILRAIHRHRLLRSTHLVALLGGSRQTTLRRLQLLFHHGYLDRPPAQLDWYAQGSEPLVYALGNRGAAVLAAGGGRGGALRWDTSRNVSRQFLRHTLAVAEVNGCSYCLSAHTYLGKNLVKLSDAEMAANRDGGSTDPKAAAAVRFATEIVRTRGHVSDADLKAVKDAGYSDAQIIEIVLNVALNTLTNYVNVVAKTEIDFPVVTAKAA